MKKSILILGAALALAGCSQPEGAATDQYTTDRGTGSRAATNTPSTTTITNQAAPSSDLSPTPPQPIPDKSQGGASTPGGANYNSGTGTSTNADTAPPTPTPSTPPNP